MTEPSAIWNDAAFLRRFWAKVWYAGPDDCWAWKASGIGRRGRIWLDGRMVLAPRVAKVLSDCHWPAPGLLACHSCCNPRHIWWGTVGENTRDASAKGRLRGPSQHTHCKKGHPLTDENRLSGANRGCRICRNERFADWQRKARTASEAGDAQNLSHKPPHRADGTGPTNPTPSNVGPHTSKGAK